MTFALDDVHAAKVRRTIEDLNVNAKAMIRRVRALGPFAPRKSRSIMYLAAGVVENGRRIAAVRGTPQGSVVSPLLANIYLHYVLDLWAHQWRRKYAWGDVIIVRYADDSVYGFESEKTARRFLAAM